MILWTVMRQVINQFIIEKEKDSRDNNTWDFSLLYLGLECLCQYLPIALEITSIYLAIIGNWPELIYCELIIPDETIDLNSHMFKSLKEDLN